MSVIKGQNLRVFVGTKCIAAATDCSIKVDVQTENTETKDSTGSWSEAEVTGRSWSLDTNGLVVDTDTTGMTGHDLLDTLVAASNPSAVTLTYTRTNGNQNRTESAKLYTGSAILTSYSESASNKANTTFSASFTGTGALTKVGASQQSSTDAPAAQ